MHAGRAGDRDDPSRRAGRRGAVELQRGLLPRPGHRPAGRRGRPREPRRARPGRDAGGRGVRGVAGAGGVAGLDARGRARRPVPGPADRSHRRRRPVRTGRAGRGRRPPDPGPCHHPRKPAGHGDLHRPRAPGHDDDVPVRVRPGRDRADAATADLHRYGHPAGGGPAGGTVRGHAPRRRHPWPDQRGGLGRRRGGRGAGHARRRRRVRGAAPGRRRRTGHREPVLPPRRHAYRCRLCRRGRRGTGGRGGGGPVVAATGTALPARRQPPGHAGGTVGLAATAAAGRHRPLRRWCRGRRRRPVRGRGLPRSRPGHGRAGDRRTLAHHAGRETARPARPGAVRPAGRAQADGQPQGRLPHGQRPHDGGVHRNRDRRPAARAADPPRHRRRPGGPGRAAHPVRRGRPPGRPSGPSRPTPCCGR